MPRSAMRSGFREFTRADEDKLADWLATEVCPVELRDEQLREALLVRCRRERLEPPGRIERIIRSARATFDQQFCDRTVAGLGVRCNATALVRRCVTMPSTCSHACKLKTR